MKRKSYHYIIVIAALLLTLVGCNSNSSSDNTANETTDAPVVTANIADGDVLEPQETEYQETDAPVSEAEYDGKVYKNDGVQLEYDASVFEAKEEDGTNRILPNDTDKDAQKNLNLYINVMQMKNVKAADMEKELTASDDTQTYDKSTVTIGTGNDKCTKISVKEKETTFSRHEYYLVERSDSLWFIELKCPSKYEKKYGEKMDKVLSTLSFDK